jgi:hypothetical protein
MPNRRPRAKGSFGGHFDELVKHFPDDEAKPETEDDGKRRKDKRHINDKLFESAWRKPARPNQISGFSNQ